VRVSEREHPAYLQYLLLSRSTLFNRPSASPVPQGRTVVDASGFSVFYTSTAVMFTLYRKKVLCHIGKQFYHYTGFALLLMPVVLVSSLVHLQRIHVHII
jgi:hypothetical protein